MMARANALCQGCKNKIDNLSRNAKAQGKGDWFGKVRSNDVQTQQMLAEYTRRAALGTTEARNITMQYLETVILSAATIVETIGEMMHFNQYAEHAETHAGGKLSLSDSKIQWKEWETQLALPGSTWPPTDLCGPKEDSPALQFR